MRGPRQWPPSHRSGIPTRSAAAWRLALFSSTRLISPPLGSLTLASVTSPPYLHDISKQVMNRTDEQSVWKTLLRHTSSQNPQGIPVLSVPDHSLIEIVGSGAYGEVWLARNAVGTSRAVK